MQGIQPKMHSIDEKTAQSATGVSGGIPTMVQQSGSGAPEQQPGAKHDTGYVVGVDIGATNLRVALADATGAIVARQSASTAGTRDPQLVVDLIQQATNQLLEEKSLSRNALRAIAAGAPGVTDVNAGVVLATSYLHGWRDVPLQAMLECVLDIPAAIDNDVNLAALGEFSAGIAQAAKDFVFLAVGTGIGAGIFLNGAPFRGTDWTAGEIGYMLVPGTPEEPAGPGEPGALESMASGEGIRRQWQSAWDPERTRLPKELTATQIFDHAMQEDGDPSALAILQRSARLLAYALYNVSLVLSCPLFVLGGTVGLHPALANAVQAALRQREDRAHCQVSCSILGSDAQLHGAIRMALDTAVASRSQAGFEEASTLNHRPNRPMQTR
jgi:glucokinase